MKFAALLTALLCFCASAEKPISTWTDLKTKRDTATVHQEFEVTRVAKTAHGTQSSKWQLTVDMSQGKWREKSASGSGNSLRIFDGDELLSMEEGGSEYVRVRRHPKDADPVPSPYLASDADWPKAVELERRRCGLSGKDHECVVVEVRLKPWTKSNALNTITRMVDGSARILADTETGFFLGLRTLENIQSSRSAYQLDTNYVLKRLSFGGTQDASLFRLPSEYLREVKELSPWNAARIRKDLKGRAAPDLALTDIKGQPVVLSALKGKTVLLDFWTTWCPPCRADAPYLDKLYDKYAARDLTIVGISVSEERAVVEQFLKAHPHDFPIVLTTENEMPTAYQISTFPTYIVIEKDGTLASAVEGDQGFPELRKLLKKAGLEVD